MERETTFERSRMLLGEQGIHTLHESHVAIIGLGGVGGHCTEALARAGIGRLFLLDGDTIAPSNMNRQLIATKKTLYMPKAEAMRARVTEVSDCLTKAVHAHLNSENVDNILPHELSFIVDAIDDVQAKLALIQYATNNHVPIISAMGAGNRLDPCAFYVTDIYATQGCPLARAVRQGCRKLGVERLPVVMSHEPPQQVHGSTPGSVSFVPAAAGLVLAGYVVNTLCKAPPQE